MGSFAGPCPLFGSLSSLDFLVNESIKEHQIELIAISGTKHMLATVIRAFSGQNIFLTIELRHPLNILL
jgi:hypothetical protein